ncbi:aminopeptidase [Pedobacter sp. PACM 27299]|uniref:C1 family peptidase n=1 Tax=Pedobacter sp. PACM 27299 TaxID=1727164 RepID=UPI0007060DB4|nr:C1 family peptidase [Pedobacter sp. PACM 27299]ALL07692.1 aminopeptidase [Pedobacter sp. PACM 27299]
MKKIFLIACSIGFSFSLYAQEAPLKKIKDNAATSVKNQGQSGTCWNYSTTSLIESEEMRKGLGEFNLSEMFPARNIYIEKAKNYVLRQGKAQFGEGGLGHDLIRAISLYGAMPQEAFQGVSGEIPDHSGLELALKSYLDTVLTKRPIANNWLIGYEEILDKKLGTPPANFDYKGKNYTPKTFAKEVLKFDASDYVNISSFTHHPYYSSFVLEAPDNFANGSFYNLPLEEMVNLTKTAVKNGYTVMWDADVSSKNFQQKKGYAMLFADDADVKAEKLNPNAKEKAYSPELRQKLYEDLTTQDDHLMHLVGLDQATDGKYFFKVKNSWGDVGPFKGYIEVSEPYFAINTVSLVVPKAALSSELKKKLGI